jgi:hypothetical protein
MNLRLPKIVWHALVALALALFLAGYAALLIALAGCAGRRPVRVYNDTCDLCITVRRVPPHRPAPPHPGPRPGKVPRVR